MTLSRLTKALCAAVVASACTTGTGEEADPGTGPSSSALELAPPEHGFQVASKRLRVEAGDDVRWCEVVALPGRPSDRFPITRIEAAMTGQGRELVVSAAIPGTDTEAIMDAGARVPCNRAGEAFGEALEEVISTQHSYLDQRYPEGVGKALWGGQRLVLEYHYYNDTSEAVTAKVKVNFHLAEEGEVERIAHLANFHNLTIYTPPDGDSTHLGECGIGENIRISELVRRTRKWGTDFRVWVLGGDRDGELLWHSADHRDTNYEFETPLALAPGQGLRFECAYHNTSEAELHFGATAEDEICSLQAIYWLTEPSEEDTAAAEGCLLLNVDEDGVARN